MDIIQLIALSVTQGITEFLPVSSSAHLIIITQLFEWPEQSIVIDTTAHLGSLFAFFLYLYFNKSGNGSNDGFLQLTDKLFDIELIKKIVIATIPALIFGFSFRDIIVTYARNAEVIAITTILFAIVLFIADRRRGKRKTIDLSYKEVFLIGLAQSIALIPGVSRSGVTLAAGLFLGLSRTDALRFAVLLSIPIISLASFSELGVLIVKIPKFDLSELVYVFISSMLSAYFCLFLLFKFIAQIGLLPFVIYRLILGCLILIFLI
ncbi:undecaprenyl-diphosphate phosphatase [Pseudomonadota bacterium]|nr:undecaprenyl-diphosphate phosphatase [Pseudomonadota bacterium]|tara:strand:- start:817 stop:1608 length:792 start_codon:yes stop_codon:yes gene_type:complete